MEIQRLKSTIKNSPEGLSRCEGAEGGIRSLEDRLREITYSEGQRE